MSVQTLHLRVRDSGDIDVFGTLQSVQQYQSGGSQSKVHDDHLTWDTISTLAKILRENRLSAANAPDEFITLGRNLWKVLLDNKAGALLLNELKNPNLDLLRVELEFADGQQTLSRWPWEYLYIPANAGIPGSADFLAGRVSLVLTRRLALEGWRPLSVDTKLKVLFVAARPNDVGPVGYERVLEVLQELEAQGLIELNALVDAVGPDNKIEVTGPDWLPKASRDNFNGLLAGWGPHVVHFIGHGKCEAEASFIAFVDQAANADWFKEDELRLVNNKSVRLVFLQACETAMPLADPYHAMFGFARRVAGAGIPAVIGMQYRVTNRVAETFAKNFYKALADHETVDVAVKNARMAVMALKPVPGEAGRPFGLPVLYYNEAPGSPGGVLVPEPPSSSQGGVQPRQATAPAPAP